MAIRAIDHVRREGLTATPIRHAPEGATQSYKAGTVLIASSGKLVTGADDPAAATIVGVAIADATGTEDEDVAYIPALPHLTFEATLDDELAAGHILAETNLFVAYSLKVDPNGFWFVDENDSTGGQALVVRLVDPVGTAAGRVLFQFKIASTIYA